MLALLIRIELLKTFARKQAWIGLGISTLIPVALNLILGYGEGVVSAKAPITGYTGCLLGLAVGMSGPLPLLASVVACELLAGELQEGSLRFMLIGPLRRSSLVLGKFFTACIFNCCLMGAMAISSLVSGGYLFSIDVIYLDGGGAGGRVEGLLRTIGAFGLGALALCVTSALSILVASAAPGMPSAVMVSLSIIILAGFLCQYGTLADFLFIGHIDVWHRLFENTIPWGDVVGSLGLMAFYAFLFVYAGIWLFDRRDVL